jgi:uncharacterized membrane protein YhaH (DUF805 family)
MADIFLSYAREDRARADQIARGLEALGFAVFWDTEVPPGQTWADYIESKLSQSKVMIVLWSAASTGSQWVREEARMGRDKGALIPVMLDASSPPFGFGEVQAANLSAWRGASDDAEWRRFVDAVRARVGAPANPPRPQPQQNFFAPPPPAAPGAAMSPLDYVKKCLRLYFDARGRARRAEYWWWALFFVVVLFAGAVLDAMAFGINPDTETANLQVFTGFAWLGLVAPGVCVTVRRFHDVGLSGWLYLAGIVACVVGGALAVEIPALGGLILLAAGGAMFAVTVIPSRPGANAYGPNPKGI